jgi:uncharacterized protein YggE
LIQEESMPRLGFLVSLPLLAATLSAQTPASNTIQATATATIQANPDQVQLTVGVVTNGSTAEEAAQSNATQTTAMIAAVKQVIGAAGTIQTVGYSVMPRYSTGSQPAIVGYQASNTLQVITTDLSLPGKIIDAANAAGANNIGSLSFGLQDPEPVMEQALSQASTKALAHTGAIAKGLKVNTGPVVSAQEGSTVIPYTMSTAGAASTPTPVQTGTVSVTASVTVNVQITQ